MAGSDDCLFCKIGRGEIPSKRVHEDERSFAFEDINPKAPTHVLICPKDHVPSLVEAEASDEADLGHLLAVAARIARERGLDSYRAVVNTGAGAGQSVFHLHVHLLGGRSMKWPPG
jgi:histidine triad (HIT) family protein